MQPDGYFEASIYFYGAVTAQDYSGSEYYTETMTWDFPFTITQLGHFGGIVGRLGSICNASISDLYTETKQIGFRMKFPTAKNNETLDAIISVSGWI